MPSFAAVLKAEFIAHIILTAGVERECKSLHFAFIPVYAHQANSTAERNCSSLTSM
jgi:hypothetical protein